MFLYKPSNDKSTATTIHQLKDIFEYNKQFNYLPPSIIHCDEDKSFCSKEFNKEICDKYNIRLVHTYGVNSNCRTIYQNLQRVFTFIFGRNQK